MNILEIILQNLPAIEKIIKEKCEIFHKSIFLSSIEELGSHPDAELPEILSRIAAVRTFTWELIHIGHWNEVDVQKRIDYSIATFLEVILMLKMNDAEDDYQIFIDCLKELDTGILLGASVVNEGGEDVLKSAARLISVEVSMREEFRSIPLSTKVELRPSHGVVTKMPASVETQVDSLELPSIQEFRENFFSPRKPAVLLECINHWPARDKWKDLGYFIHHFGHRTVPIEIGSQYTEANWGQKLVQLKDFIERQFISRSEETVIEYLAQHDLLEQIPELKEDIRIPDYCYADTTETDVEVKMWFGPWGTVSPLHYDKKHNLLAQVVGTKRILLADPHDAEAVYPFDGKMLSNTSQVDLENVDWEKFPKIREIAFYQVHLHEGEVLYIPPGWWHHVRAISNSISLSFWWESSKE
ncbi:bifunctional peptidase and arginyl-hydroxylase JMJD5 [Lutzomyia longipalpis]|uniref:bifunctional peptidase and arginyl-hydroxylase JMJD5 n=1 Tax=Lutzomyia longipalpis TaxID=7200 RepID=UPI002483DDB9|nr:bifunctional peptidase and arginyl-hydroxylase JMJD5 [Lutzomyia longipalpis]